MMSGWTWLPYVLGTLTALFVARCFWEKGSTVRLWHAVGTAVLIVGLLASISVTADAHDPDPTSRRSATDTDVAAPATTAIPPSTLVTGADVPASVQGAVEVRSDADRLVSCETALAQIASAIRQTASDGAAAPSVPSEDELTAGATDPARRLQSCEVRLQAIAATLPG